MIPDEQVERRIRAALTARADQITVTDLRPAAPPSTAPLPFWRRTLWMPVLAGATVVATVLAVAVAVRTPAPVPEFPPASPGVSSPSAETSPSSSSTRVTGPPVPTGRPSAAPTVSSMPVVPLPEPTEVPGEKAASVTVSPNDPTGPVSTPVGGPVGATPANDGPTAVPQTP